VGIGFVLAAWAIVGTVLAGLAAIVLGTISYLATRQVQSPRRIAVILTVVVFPFLGLGWAATVFVFQAIINETMLHRDPGAGDAWQCPLPNGYAILMIDEMEHGTVYNPKTQLDDDGVGVGEHDQYAVAGVRKLQIAGKYILGGADSKAFGSPSSTKDRIDEYFLLDTQAGTRSDFSEYGSLSAAAAPLGIHANLEPIATVYSRYRFTWFEVFAGVLFVVPPILAATLLTLWIRRLRRDRASV
jgi:hypothetical protein